MNQPDVVLFEKNACCSQSNTCVHFSSLFTSSQSTGMSTCNFCNVCGKYFKRLESHVSQNFACKSCLVVSMQQQQWHRTSQMTAAMWTPTSHVLQGASRSCLNLRSLSTWKSLNSIALSCIQHPNFTMPTTISIGMDLMTKCKWFKRSCKFDGNWLRPSPMYQCCDAVT